MKRNILQEFTILSRSYNADVNRLCFVSPEKVANALLAEIEDIQNPRIGDLGTGTGLVAREIKKQKPDCFIIGVDGSKEMLEYAKPHTDETILKNLKKPIKKLGAQTLDAVSMSGVGEFLDPEALQQAFSTAAKALKPKSPFIFTVIPSREPIKRTRYEEIADTFSYNLNYIKKLLKENGFTFESHERFIAYYKDEELRDPVYYNLICARTLE